jgi:hypothetical protein
MATFGAFFFFFFQKIIWTVCDPSFFLKISKWQKIAKKRTLHPQEDLSQIWLQIRSELKDFKKKEGFLILLATCWNLLLI